MSEDYTPQPGRVLGEITYRVSGVDFVFVRIERQNGDIVEMAKYPTTQEQYQAIMGKNPAHFRHGPDAPKRPVESVNWYDSREYAEKLTAAIREQCPDDMLAPDVPFDLPEDEVWMYCALAGQDTKFSGSDNALEVGWFAENANGSTQPVGRLKPNAWGLHDMSGNVWEWTLTEEK
jgi:Uncharacterized conserved protein